MKLERIKYATHAKILFLDVLTAFLTLLTKQQIQVQEQLSLVVSNVLKKNF